MLLCSYEISRARSPVDWHTLTALRVVVSTDFDRPVSQVLKHQKLVKDADAIGDDIESLSRFAALQKTAFRKILKRNRKWTGSTILQTRLENDVFGSCVLQVDYAEYLQRLASLTTVISTRLQVPMVTGGEALRARRNAGRTLSQSNAQTVNDLCSQGCLHFYAALD